MRGQGELVLYLDDEEPLVEIISRALNRLGYRVAGFTAPAEALRVFRESPGIYAAAIVDFNMPGVSGLRVAEEMLRLRPDMPIALTSGFVTEELHQSTRALGIRDIIHKPSRAEDVVKTLQGMLTRPMEPAR